MENRRIRQPNEMVTCSECVRKAEERSEKVRRRQNEAEQLIWTGMRFVATLAALRDPGLTASDAEHEANKLIDRLEGRENYRRAVSLLASKLSLPEPEPKEERDGERETTGRGYEAGIDTGRYAD